MSVALPAYNAKTLFSLLESKVHEYSSRVALQSHELPPISFTELFKEINNIHSSYQNAGYGAESRIAIVLPQGIEMAVACLATISYAICAPLNASLTFSELSKNLTELRVDLVITHRSYEHVVQAALHCQIPVAFLENEKLPKDSRFSILVPVASKFSKNAELARTGAEVCLLLLTSGTTSASKIVPLSHGNLLASIRNLVQSLQLNDQDRCFNMMPMYHVGGLVDLLLAPLVSGGSVYCSSGIGASYFYQGLKEYAPSWSQAVPAMLHDILAHQQNHSSLVNKHSLRFMRAVSSALSDTLARRFESVFQIPIVEIYGMTETAGVISSSDIRSKFQKPGSVGKVVGSKIQILDEQGNKLAAGKQGEIVVYGENVFSGYEKAESVIADYFIEDWFRTGDVGFLDEDGYLYLSGRKKEIINRGGEKIAPREIEEILLAHPHVIDAAAFPIRHATLGEEVAVAVVLLNGSNLSEKDLLEFIKDKLSPFKQPKLVFVEKQLPRTSGGKLIRRRLSEKYNCYPIKNNLDNEGYANTKTTKLIAESWAKVLDVKEVKLLDNFFSLGGDSLSAATLMYELNSKLGIEIEMSSLFDTPTLLEFVQYIEQQFESGSEKDHRYALPQEVYREIKAYTSAWKNERHSGPALILGRNTAGTKQPIFWFTPLGREIESVVNYLGHDQPVYAGRPITNKKHKSFNNSWRLAELYVEELLAIQPEGSFILVGNCEGGKLVNLITECLIEKKRNISLICMIEAYINPSFTGNYALFYSGANPYRNRFQKENLQEDIINRNNNWPKVFRLTGAHAEHFLPQNIAEFGSILKSVIADVGKSAANIYVNQARLDSAISLSYAIRVKTKALFFLQTGEKVIIQVFVKNTMFSPIAKTSESGWVLASRWLNHKSSPKVYLENYMEIDQDIPAGGVQTFNLEICAPLTPGIRNLNLDLVQKNSFDFDRSSARAVKVHALVTKGTSIWLWPKKLFNKGIENV